MATFTTPNYDLQNEARTTNISRLATPNVASGSIEYADIPYVISAGATEAANDIINLMLLPAGAIPMPALSKCVCETDPGTAFTVKVGTAVSATGIAGSVAMTVPGAVAFDLAGAAAQPAWLTATPIVPDTGSGNAVVFATVITATALTAATVVHFIIAFKRGR